MYRDYLKPYYENVIVSKIHSNDIDKTITTLVNNTSLSHRSINHIFSLFRTVMNYGIDKNFVKINPISSKKFLPIHEQAINCWEQEEASKFLTYTSKKYKEFRSPYLIYLIALTTGMRKGEIIALTFDNIILTKGNEQIIITKTYDRTVKDIKNSTKSGKPRYIGINKKLIPELIKQKKLGNNIVCPNTAGNYFDPGNLSSRFFLKDIKEAEVKKIKFHELRKTYGSIYVKNGGDLYALQKILGHSDPRLTAKTYAALSPKHIPTKANIVKYD